MDCALNLGCSSVCLVPVASSLHSKLCRNSLFLPKIDYGSRKNKLGSGSYRAVPCAVGDVNRQRSSLESLFCYDKPIPEEIIEKPVGISLAEKNIGGNPRCSTCEAKGAVLCPTCGGSGLYVDSILESQGIIVKVRCLGCGGTGNTMCTECGGRGHT